MRMTFDEIKAIGIKKGQRIQFTRSEGGKVWEGTVKKVIIKTAWQGAKVIKNAAGKKQYYEISFSDLSDGGCDILEDTFQSIKIIK